MNTAQLELLLLNRVKCHQKRAAIHMVIIDKVSSYAAEMQVYGRTTSTINRLVLDVRKDYNRCLEVAALASI